MSNKYILVVMTAVVGIIVAALVGFEGGNPQPIACTMEAKICPDGSAVGRTGPNCEFAECPFVVGAPALDNGQVTLGLGEKGTVGDLSITVNSIVSDSRCPSDVQCIWAGELKVNVTFAAQTKTETVDIVLGAPALYLWYKVALLNAEPAPKSTAKIADKDYKFTFDVALVR